MGLIIQKFSMKPSPMKTSLESVDDVSISLDEDDIRSGSHIKNLQEQIHNLQLEKEVHTKKVDDLQNKLQIENERCKKIQESANHMVHALEMKDLYVGQQDSDEDIKSRFRVLIGQIRTWSVPFAQVCPPSQLEFAAEMNDEFEKVAPGVTDLPRFLQTPRNLRLVVRGYVGLAITEMLFRTLPSGSHPGSCGVDVWMDKELAHSVFLVENRLSNAGKLIIYHVECALIAISQDRQSISLHEFHDWRALTMNLISKSDDASSETNESVEGYVTQCRNWIMDVVGELVAAKNRRALEDGLLAVLKQAVRLSRTLRCQRAYWSVRHPGAMGQRAQSGLPSDLVLFDEATMDDVDGNEDSDAEGTRIQYGKIIEIFVTPSLFKSGNSDGERFDVEACIERSEVKCRTLSTRHGRPC